MVGKLETNGIDLLGKERPDILIKICKDNFLPPSQMICALHALEWYPDKQSLIDELSEFLTHWSSAVKTQAYKTMGIKEHGDTA